MIISLTSLGKSKEIFPHSQIPWWFISATESLVSFWVNGPSMSSLTDWPFTQLSFQNVRLELLPTFHPIPCLTTGNPILIVAYIGEKGSISGSLDLLQLWEQYLLSKTLAYNASFSWYSLQFSFARRAMFLALAAWSPRPPSFFGLAILFHLTRWSFLFSMVDPHRKSRLILSIFSHTCTGRAAPCMM